MYVAAAAVGGGGAPLFASGAFCGDLPRVWAWRAACLACAVAAYVLPLFCFAGGGLGLGAGGSFSHEDVAVYNFESL